MRNMDLDDLVLHIYEVRQGQLSNIAQGINTNLCDPQPSIFPHTKSH